MAVQLGVAQRSASLQIANFPLGKVGGAPLWLLPGEPKCCATCGGALTFALQIYCPLEECPQAFHRYIYVFLCRTCRAAKVFRAQLPQKNELYLEEAAPEEEDKDEEISDEQLMEMLAGVSDPAPKPTRGEDRPDIALDIVDENSDITAAARELFGLNLRDSSAVEDFSERLPSDPTAPRIEVDADEEVDEDEIAALDSIVKEHSKVDSDVSFELFRLSSLYKSKQCVRYDRNGTPLWYSDKGRPSLIPPPCELCGARRVFEFQVMPQVIDIGALEDTDFGCIYVFTCESSCGENNYSSEFALLQDSL